MQKGSYFISGFISIKNGHVAVHEDKFEATFLIDFKVISYCLNCLNAAEGSYTFSVNFADFLDDDLQGLNVEILVIDDKDLFLGCLDEWRWRQIKHRYFMPCLCIGLDISYGTFLNDF